MTRSRCPWSNVTRNLAHKRGRAPAHLGGCFECYPRGSGSPGRNDRYEVIRPGSRDRPLSGRGHATRFGVGSRPPGSWFSSRSGMPPQHGVFGGRRHLVSRAVEPRRKLRGHLARRPDSAISVAGVWFCAQPVMSEPPAIRTRSRRSRGHAAERPACEPRRSSLVSGRSAGRAGFPKPAALTNERP